MKKLTLKIWEYILWAYNKTHWFTDKEAWTIYRIFAFAEALGWSLLIGAIIYRSFDLPYYEAFISVAGRIHGMFFVAYFMVVVATARSMQWGIWRMGFAVLAGMPPLGSLVFEQAMAFDRRKRPVYVTPPDNVND
ncbi:MAG: DUF3817 domain-containing protein [Candidatus Microsaccharimonas sp.]